MNDVQTIQCRCRCSCQYVVYVSFFVVVDCKINQLTK